MRRAELGLGAVSGGGDFRDPGTDGFPIIHTSFGIPSSSKKPRRSRANLRPPSRSASVIDRLLKKAEPIGKS